LQFEENDKKETMFLEAQVMLARIRLSIWHAVACVVVFSLTDGMGLEELCQIGKRLEAALIKLSFALLRG
jgi:hypothetical protein